MFCHVQFPKDQFTWQETKALCAYFITNTNMHIYYCRFSNAFINGKEETKPLTGGGCVNYTRGSALVLLSIEAMASLRNRMLWTRITPAVSHSCKSQWMIWPISGLLPWLLYDLMDFPLCFIFESIDSLKYCISETVLLLGCICKNCAKADAQAAAPARAPRCWPPSTDSYQQVTSNPKDTWTTGYKCAKNKHRIS